NTLIPLADRVDGNRFYLWDGTAKRLLTSADGGSSFSVIASGVNSAFTGFHTVPGHQGHLWVRAENGGLFRSTDFGTTFNKINAVAAAYRVGFGKAKPGSTHPAVFIWGKVGTTVGIFRSDDIGATWTRVNDDQHQFGYPNDITGDPRVYGRVYLATSGRGVVVGDIADPPSPPSQSSQIIYDNALGSGWANASPGETNLESSNPVRRGSRAIAVPAGDGKGFAVTCSDRSLEGYAALAFLVNGGSSGPPPLQVGFSRGGIPLEGRPITVPAVIGWQRIVVPFAELDFSNIPDLTGLRIESRTVNGVPPGAFWLDDIQLVGNDACNGISTATIDLGNLNQTYDGSAKSVTVTTHPAGLPVAVLYNGGPDPPVNAGSYVVSAFIDDPAIIGSATGTLVIAKADASIQLGDLSAYADGTPKSSSYTTTPQGLPVSFTYAGSSTAPSLAGSYEVVAAIDHPNYQGTTMSNLLIRQPALEPTGITGWISNIAGKVTGGSTSSPLLNPNDTTDPYSSNTLQANFSPITLANPGDKIALNGTFQLSAGGVSGQINWFRFGLYDNRGQAPNEVGGWLGLTGLASSIWERTSAGLFSTGTGGTQRAPDASPAPVSSVSLSGTPLVAFEATATRTANAVIYTHKLIRTDTNAVLMNYAYTDDTPNNNGILGSAQNTPINYTPTFNAAGFAFGRSYIASTGAQAQFYHITLAFEPGITTLEEWRYGYFQTYDNIGDAADIADPDGDGLANLMEFAVGLDPTLPSTSPLRSEVRGALIELTYTRAKAAVVEVDFIVEWSDTLAGESWSTAGVMEISPPLADDGVVETILVTVPAEGDRRFVRLRVTRLSTVL
nr:MBG domain-containing protein [Akkermansiaceae bacterium]